MNNTIIAVYEKQKDAITAVEKLKDQGFTQKHISLLGKHDSDDLMQSHAAKETAGILGSTVSLGVLAGVLTGVGLLAIPGIGFLYGAGALAGAIAGVDFGVIGGGVLSAILLDGEKSRIADLYEKELLAGKTLLVLKLSADDAEKGMETIKSAGNFKDVQMH
ncbi:MAG TPA: general stress protein [Edaphocola sp.]|nr:general stress protein [Edaphocola sp.]